MVARLTAPRFLSSSSTRVPILKKPGEVSMMLRSSYLPEAMPAATKNGLIDEPSAGVHQGGQVSAPVFSAVVGGALRLLAVAPDKSVNAPEELPSTPTSAPMRTAALP